MGKLVVTIGVGDQQGRQFEDLEVTVDTGSTFTAVPRTLLQRLGVPVRRSARSRLADGSTVPVDIGWTVVRLEVTGNKVKRGREVHIPDDLVECLEDLVL